MTAKTLAGGTRHQRLSGQKLGKPRTIVRGIRATTGAESADLVVDREGHFLRTLERHGVKIYGSKAVSKTGRILKIYGVKTSAIERKRLENPFEVKLWVDAAQSQISKRAAMRNAGNQGALRTPTPSLDGPASGQRSTLRSMSRDEAQERMRRETLAAFGFDPNDPSL